MKICSLLVIYMLLISMAGCSDENVNNAQNNPITSPQIITDENPIESKLEFPLDQLKIEDIEFITKKGGLPSTKNWAVLYPEKDEEKLVKIINLIKSCSDIHKSTDDDLDFMKGRHGYPVDIVIKMKDGNQFYLKEAMKATITKRDNGTEKKLTSYKDHFLLAYEKDNSIEYYTIYSDAATEYLLVSSDEDLPRLDG